MGVGDWTYAIIETQHSIYYVSREEIEYICTHLRLVQTYDQLEM